MRRAADFWPRRRPDLGSKIGVLFELRGIASRIPAPSAEVGGEEGRKAAFVTENNDP